MSVTDLPAYWKKPPASISDNLYKKVRDIDFGRQIHWKFFTNNSSTSSSNTSRCRDLLNTLQTDELNVAAASLFCGEENMDFSCTDCAYETEMEADLKDYNLQLLYDPLNTDTEAELKERASAFIRNLPKDPAMLKRIDTLTTSQSDSKWWNMFRSGRITASNLKDVCNTRLERPSVSLIKKICYPSEISFSTAATRYGKKNEDKAVDQLYHSVKHLHINLQKKKSGLVIDSELPFLGASPDAIFLCDCHGIITIEVKCPFSARNREDMTDTLLQLTDSFIARNEDGQIILKMKHKYYFQALMQVHVCKARFGYFYVWSPKQVLVFEIKRRDEFWQHCKDKAVCFFETVLFPELINKSFTNK